MLHSVYRYSLVAFELLFSFIDAHCVIDVTLVYVWHPAEISVVVCFLFLWLNRFNNLLC